MKFFRSPSVTKELAALVYAEDQEDVLTCPKRLVQNFLVMRLSRPNALLFTYVQVVLKEELEVHPPQIKRRVPKLT